MRWAASLAKRVKGAQRAEEAGAGVELGGWRLEDQCTDLSDPQECALLWATETNVFVCSYVLAPGLEWIEANDLGGEYYDGAVGIVEVQIVKAGLRAAAWVNAVAALRRGGEGFREDL